MKFLIRVDDIGMTPEETKIPPGKKWDHGLNLAREFNAAMNGAPWLAACVPAMCDDFGIEWIKQASEPTIALHGWDHCDECGCRNEFENLGVEECRDSVARGQVRVGPTPYFVPPWNAFTPNFVEGAWHEGIRHIFGVPSAWPTPPSPTEIHRGIKFWPAWSCLYGALAWDQGCDPILKTLPALLDLPGRAVITLHITWEAARDPKFKHTREFSDMIRGHAISAEEFVS